MLPRLRRWKRLWCSGREARRFLDGAVAGLCECGVLVRLFFGGFFFWLWVRLVAGGSGDEVLPFLIACCQAESSVEERRAKSEALRFGLRPFIVSMRWERPGVGVVVLLDCDFDAASLSCGLSRGFVQGFTLDRECSGSSVVLGFDRRLRSGHCVCACAGRWLACCDRCCRRDCFEDGVLVEDGGEEEKHLALHASPGAALMTRGHAWRIIQTTRGSVRKVFGALEALRLCSLVLGVGVL